MHFILVLDHALLPENNTGYEKHLTWAGVRELSGNFTLSVEWSPCFSKSYSVVFAVPYLLFYGNTEIRSKYVALSTLRFTNSF